MTRLIFAILFVTTIGYVATDLYLPSLPAISKYLQTDPSLVQLTIPLYMVSFGLAHLFFGPLSDKVGRRPVLLFGLLFSLLGTVSTIFVSSVFLLIMARFIQGIGLGAAVCNTRPIIRDIAHGDQFAHISSILTTSAAAFMAAAPALGGYLQHFFGWRSAFIFLSIYTLVVCLFSWLWIPETHKERNVNALKPKIFFRNYLTLLTSPIFLGYTLAASCALGGTISYFTASPFVLQTNMGLSPVAYGWTVIIIAIGMCSGGALNQVLLKLYGRHRSLNIGIALLYLGGILMFIGSFWPSPVTFVLPVGFYALGMAITVSNSSAGTFTPFPKMAGFAGALFGCLFILGAAVSSSLIASFENQTPRLVSYFLLSCATLSLGLSWIAFLAVDKK